MPQRKPRSFRILTELQTETPVFSLNIMFESYGSRQMARRLRAIKGALQTMPANSNQLNELANQPGQRRSD